MLKPWITSLALVSSLAAAGFALAQSPPPVEPGAVDRASLTGGTSVIGKDGKPIMTADQPRVDRPVGTSLTVPMTPDGKPITSSTSFGQRQ